MTIPFSLERFVSSSVLGLALGWICWRTGSVIPGMILHGLHNAMLVIYGPSSVSLTSRMAAGGAVAGVLPLGESGVPTAWLLAGLGGSLVGFALIWWLGPTRPRPPQAESPAG